MKLWVSKTGQHLFRLDLLAGFLSAGISLLLAKMWGTSLQGSWSILNNFTSVSAMIFSAGLPSVLLSMMRRKELNEAKITRQFILYMLVLGLVLIVALFWATRSVSVKFLVSELAYSFGGPLLISIQVVFLVMVNIAGAWMDGKNKLSALTASRLVLTILTAISIILLYIVFRDQPQKFIHGVWYTFILQSLLLLVFIGYSISRIPTEGPSNAASDSSLIHLVSQTGWIYLLSEFFQRLNYKADLWFLSAYTTAGQVGIYSVASTLSLFLLLRPRNSQRVLINSFQLNTYTHNDMLIRHEIKVLARECLFLSMAFFIASYFLFSFFLGQEYKEGFEIAAVLIVGIYAISVTMPFSAYFVYLNKPSFNLAAAGTGLGINLICNAFWVPTLGIWGATWASVCTYGSTALVLYLLYRNYYTGLIKS